MVTNQMKDQEKKNRIKPGLEEALHPEIGNGAAWTADDHNFSLSTPDPLKAWDEQIIDEAAREKTLSAWNAPFGEKEITESTPIRMTAEIKTQTEHTSEMDEEEEIFGHVESKKERKKKEKAAHKFSKRIKKVADKVKKEQKESRAGKTTIFSGGEESNLSPFTHWLKGLKGSEYVHPYHDDFALGHGQGASGEVISETYADLLAAQGYKDQAIAMYTQLKEKFPEKSSFFAAKIEALQ
ncbi:MAG TPA: hypothetical protein VFV79_07005 [Saprospiraceae bacterium]|nr:hypothetical protein [Saprospiraceae bacterium]